MKKRRSETQVSRAVIDQVMWITLDGVESMNSLTPSVLQGLDDAIAVAESDHTLRAVVLTGAGEAAFSVGMDLDFLESCFADPTGIFLPFLDSFHAVLLRLERLPVPVIARVNGLARAGGFEIILACDLVVAADDARVGDIHVEFGMSPGAGSSQRAPRKLGDQRAKALMLTPRWLDGPEMVEWGLAISAAARPDLDDAVENLLSGLRGRSRPAIAVTKHLLNAARSESFDDGLALERLLFARLQTEIGEAAEGYRAFVEKRSAEWGDVDVGPLFR